MSEQDFGRVTLSEQGAVAVTIFANPPENYFDRDLIANLVAAMQEADARPHIRAIMLASDGKIFCAGARFGGGDVDVDPGQIYREAIRMFAISKPIVVAVQGAAIGGGFGLAMIGDFRVVAPEARFAANFVRLGIHPGFGLTHTLPRLIGDRAASLLFMTGRRIDGEAALAIGLADMIAPLDELAQEIALGAPLALVSTRSTLRAGLTERVSQQLEHELAEQERLFATADFQEGVRAVAERRAGQWVGR